MLQGLSEFVIRVMDLAEAEGRQLRTIISALGIGFAFLLVAAFVSVIGIGLLVLALYKALADPMGPAWAACIAGAVTLLMAGGLGYFGWKTMTPRDERSRGKP